MEFSQVFEGEWMEMKKWIVTMLTALLVLAGGPVMTNQDAQAAGVSFSDIKGHWAESSIKQAAAAGLVNGYSNGTFRPNNHVTRAEFAAMLSRATKLESKIPFDGFKDVQKGHWAKEAIDQAVKTGFINPKDYPNGFSPNTALTRYELAKWMADGLAAADPSFKQALEDTKDTLVPFAEYYKGGFQKGQIPCIAVAKGTGLVGGFPDGTFGVDKPTTRAEVAAILLRYQKIEGKKAENYSDLNEMREVGTTGANITTLTPYRYAKTNGKEDSFKNVINKTITLKGNVGTAKVHRIIVVDAKSVNECRGVYCPMFIGKGMENFIFDGKYNMFTELTVTPAKDDFRSYDLANGTTNNFVGGLAFENEHNSKYGIRTIPRIHDSKNPFFKKGVPNRIWLHSTIHKSVPSDSIVVSYSLRVDDGNTASISISAKDFD
jgi:hypothetical protein